MDLNKPISKKKLYKFNPNKIRSSFHKPTKEHTPKVIYKRPKYPKFEIESQLENLI